MFQKFPTTMDKTCWDKSWKSSKFKKWLTFSNSKFSSLPSNNNVECGQVLLPKAENFANNIDLRGEGFFDWKIDFLFCLNSFVQECRIIFKICFSRSYLPSRATKHTFGKLYSPTDTFWLPKTMRQMSGYNTAVPEIWCMTM